MTKVCYVMLSDIGKFLLAIIPFCIVAALQVYIIATNVDIADRGMFVTFVVNGGCLLTIMIIFASFRMTGDYETASKLCPTRLAWYGICMIVTLLSTYVNYYFGLLYAGILLFGLFWILGKIWYEDAKYRSTKN